MVTNRESLAINSTLKVSSALSKRLSSMISTSMNPMFTPGVNVSFPFSPW